MSPSFDMFIILDVVTEISERKRFVVLQNGQFPIVIGKMSPEPGNQLTQIRSGSASNQSHIELYFREEIDSTDL